MNPCGEDIRRSSVGVEAGIVDELVVDGKPRGGGQSVVIISLDDLFESGIRQLPVANEDAQATGIEPCCV